MESLRIATGYNGVATVLVAAAVLIAAGIAVGAIVRNKKKGKHISCGGNCESCSMGAYCRDREREDRH